MKKPAMVAGFVIFPAESVTPDRPTIVDIPKGTKIYPDAGKVIRAVLADQMRQHLTATDRRSKADPRTLF